MSVGAIGSVAYTSTETMIIEDFERRYRQLPDSLDATEVFGVTTIHNGVKTAGDIRKA